MMPRCSSRSIRLCTVVRDTPSRRASSAVEARALARSSESRACSASLSISTKSLGGSAKDWVQFAEFHASFRQASCDDFREHGSQGNLIMNKIVIVGAGKIGSTIAEMLAATGDYQVTL